MQNAVLADSIYEVHPSPVPLHGGLLWLTVQAL